MSSKEERARNQLHHRCPLCEARVSPTDAACGGCGASRPERGWVRVTELVVHSGFELEPDEDDIPTVRGIVPVLDGPGAPQPPIHRTVYLEAPSAPAPQADPDGRHTLGLAATFLSTFAVTTVAVLATWIAVSNEPLPLIPVEFQPVRLDPEPRAVAPAAPAPDVGEGGATGEPGTAEGGTEGAVAEGAAEGGADGAVTEGGTEGAVAEGAAEGAAGGPTGGEGAEGGAGPSGDPGGGEAQIAGAAPASDPGESSTIPPAASLLDGQYLGTIDERPVTFWLSFLAGGVVEARIDGDLGVIEARGEYKLEGDTATILLEEEGVPQALVYSGTVAPDGARGQVTSSQGEVGHFSAQR